MATDRSSCREDHAPRDVGGPSIEFTIDKIAEASESQPDGRDGCRKIGERIERNALSSAEPGKGHNRADQPSVKRHPAFPYSKELCWMLQVVGKVIEEGIAKPATDKDS